MIEINPNIIGFLVFVVVCFLVFGRSMFLLIAVFAMALFAGWTTRPSIPVVGTQLSFEQFLEAMNTKSSIYELPARAIADHLMPFIMYGFLIALVVAIADGISTRSKRKKIAK